MLNNSFKTEVNRKNMADSRVLLACAHASLISFALSRRLKETKDARSNHLLSNL